MIASAIAIPNDQLADICHMYGISRLDLFGSALRNDFDPSKSDIDLLVEFLPTHKPDFFTLVEIEDAFSSLFSGRKVDLVLRNSLSRWIREKVIREAQPLYAA